MPKKSASALNASSSLLQSAGAFSPNAEASTITKILRSQEELARSRTPRDRDRGDSFHHRTARTSSLASEQGAVDVASFDALTEDKLLKVGVDNIAMCDNFLVPIPLPVVLTAEQRAKFPQSGYIRVKISEYDEFDDPRITVPALRQLLHQRPHIAELLYEALAEANLISDHRVLASEGGLQEGDEDLAYPVAMLSSNNRSRLTSRAPVDDLDTPPDTDVAPITERPFAANSGGVGATEDELDYEDMGALRVEDLDEEF